MYRLQVSTMADNDLSEVRNREIGFIFQGFNLIPNLTAVENVELPLIYRGIDKKTRRQLAMESLHMVGLDKRVHHKPNEMSGGQQQRVAIARALSTKPAVLLCDEPTGNLDSVTGMEVVGLLKSSAYEFHQTIVVVTHNEEIAQMADRIIRIEDGKVKGDTYEE